MKVEDAYSGLIEVLTLLLMLRALTCWPYTSVGLAVYACGQYLRVRTNPESHIIMKWNMLDSMILLMHCLTLLCTAGCSSAHNYLIDLQNVACSVCLANIGKDFHYDCYFTREVMCKIIISLFGYAWCLVILWH